MLLSSLLFISRAFSVLCSESKKIKRMKTKIIKIIIKGIKIKSGKTLLLLFV